MGISFTQAKEEAVSSTLTGKGECEVSQSETLIQEQREMREMQRLKI